MVKMTDPDTHEVYQVHVEKDVVIKMKRDKDFYKRVLEKYKEVEEKHVALSLDSFKILKELTIYLPDGSTSSLLVDEKDYDRAMIDVPFAQTLYDTKLKESLNQNSVSKDDDTLNSDVENEKEIIDNSSKKSCQLKTTWTEAQTKLLIQEVLIFKEENGTMYKEKLYVFLVKKLEEKGYKFTQKQIQTKLDNLKRKYKEITDHNRRTGNDKKDWIHLETMDAIYSNEPWIRPITTLASDAGCSSAMESSPRNQKEKVKDIFMKKYLENMDKRREDTESYRSKKLKILEKFLSK